MTAPQLFHYANQKPNYRPTLSHSLLIEKIWPKIFESIVDEDVSIESIVD